MSKAEKNIWGIPLGGKPIGPLDSWAEAKKAIGAASRGRFSTSRVGDLTNANGHAAYVYSGMGVVGTTDALVALGYMAEPDGRR